MSVISLRDRVSEPLTGNGASQQKASPQWSDGRMYAIAFDLDTHRLKQHYPSNNSCDAYGDIRRELKAHGFEWQQGSLYFGGRGITSVHCVLAVQALSKKFPWFSKVVADIRQLRIEEHNDLMPAIGQLGLPFGSSGSATG